MDFLGIDVHWRTSTICMLKADNSTVKRKTIRGGYDQLCKFVEAIDHPIAIAFEASTGYGVLYDRFCKMPNVQAVHVAHPKKLHMIFRSMQKNDRNDAHNLARLLRLDDVPTVYVPKAATRQWRKLIEHRDSLVQARTRAKNQIHALLRGRAIKAPESLWTGKGMTWLRGGELNSELARFQLDQQIAQVEFFNQQVKAVEQKLDAIASQSDAVGLLRTIPGVGARTAEALAAYIDQPDRFSRCNQIGAYFGLVPSQDASAGMNRLGHITREGPALVRRLLAEATWQAVRHSQTIRRYFQRIHRGEQTRKKKAITATAHYLLRVALAMLKNQTPWQPAV